MIPKKNRLRKKKDIEALLAERRRTTSLLLNAIYRRVPLQGEMRIGFAVGKRTARKAAVRNRIRRRLREAVRQILPRAKGGWDILFITKPAIKEASFQDIKREIVRIFDTLKLLKEKNTKIKRA